jgi:phage baseplate assembly protein W
MDKMSGQDILGTDLKIIEHEISGKDLTSMPSTREKQDLATVSSVDNLVQAINLRLNARKGDLRELGHPDYGSRLHTLIGRLNTASNRKLLEAYVRECIKQEPRIKEIISIFIESPRAEPGRVYAHATVKPIDNQTPLNLVFPFNFEGEMP